MESVFKYMVLLLNVAFLDAVQFRCDYKYTDVGWFKYHEMPLTWYDAYLQCKFEGGMLASPITTEITNNMKKLMRKTDIFTGIHSTYAKGQYYSIDGIPLNEIPHTWAEFEPNNHDNAENCLAWDPQGNFADVNCDEPRPFICHRKLSNVDVTVCGTPDPEYQFESQTNKCYKFHSKPKRFAPAFFTCSAEGGHLAIINSKEELYIIRKLHAQYPPEKISGLYDKYSAFLGFYYKEELADWVTIHGQSLEEAGYAIFEKGQPSNSSTGEYCGAIYRNGFFNDVSCDKRFAFICEKIAHYPPVCDSDGTINGSNNGQVDHSNAQYARNTPLPQHPPILETTRYGPVF